MVRRLSEDQSTAMRRPALTDLDAREEIETVMAERRPTYRQVADYRVQTDEKPPLDVAAEVTEFVRSRL